MIQKKISRKIVVKPNITITPLRVSDLNILIKSHRLPTEMKKLNSMSPIRKTL